MMDRNIIFSPTLVSASVQLDGAHAQLYSLMSLLDADDYPGQAAWVYTTRDSLTPAELQASRLVFGLFGKVFKGYDTSWDDLDGFLSHFRQEDPTQQRDRILAAYLDWHHACCTEGKLAQATSREDFLASPAPLRNLLSLDSDDRALLSVMDQAHGLLNDPPTLRSRIADHLELMWEKYLRKPWQAELPTLRETVDAYAQLDLSKVDPLEAAQRITRRDLRHSKLITYLDQVSQVVFVPSPFIGPYVGFMGGPAIIRLIFRPQLPDEAPRRSPHLDRSELLVQLSALADDTRLQILALLAQHAELRAQDVMQHLNLSQSASSRHLRQLSATGFITEQRQDGIKLYRLNLTRITHTADALRRYLHLD
ncbi:MAG: helix-turn-helix transcriptional regulator [Anaerolineae bacterium]|nr:helix-turn-helix transcriptional regulator [Anaerolineae bacterium]